MRDARLPVPLTLPQMIGPKVKGELRVLVTGSRAWTDVETLERTLNAVWVLAKTQNLKLVVIHGAHRPKREEVRKGVWDQPRKSADWLTHLWCQAIGVEEDPNAAKWNKHGKAAGRVRNEYMVKERSPDLCIAFMHGATPGTIHCSNMAERQGIPVVRISPEAGEDYPG